MPLTDLTSETTPTAIPGRVFLFYPSGPQHQRGEDRSQGNVSDSAATVMRAPNDMGYASALAWIFLVIVLVSPGGLMGIWDSILGRLFGQRGGAPAADDSAAAPSASTGGAGS